MYLSMSEVLSSLNSNTCSSLYSLVQIFYLSSIKSEMRSKKVRYYSRTAMSGNE